jgi:hypothetical protein
MVLSDRYENPASDKSPKYTFATNQIEGLSPESKGILSSPVNGFHQKSPDEDFSPLKMGQSNSNQQNSSINTHIEESKINQNVNIYLDTRNPNNSGIQTSNNHISCDPENPEIKTSKNRPNLLSKTNLLPLSGFCQGTSINVLQKRADILDSQPGVSV